MQFFETKSGTFVNLSVVKHIMKSGAYPNRLHYSGFNTNDLGLGEGYTEDEGLKDALHKFAEDNGFLKITAGSYKDVHQFAPEALNSISFTSDGKEATVGSKFNPGYTVSTKDKSEIEALRKFLEEQSKPEPEPEPEVTPADFFHDPAGFYASYVEWAKQHPFPTK